jgi:dTDP-4-amino-4,6-dideoxygalactose transaminase
MIDKKKITNFIQKNNLNDPWDIVDLFEKKVAKFTGSKYAIAVDCCTNALFLSLKYFNSKKKLIIPENTYISILSAIKLANYNFKVKKIKWEGSYLLNPLPIIDSATRFTKKMYQKNTFTCLSFHHRKHLPIGRGGMILLDSKKAYNWLKEARYDGRNLKINYSKDNFKIAGWHMYMTPEQAFYGLGLLKKFKDNNPNRASNINYRSIKKFSKLYKL